MSNHSSKQVRGRLGFTVAELLIVMAVIAVLVGVSIPIFFRQREKAANTVDIANAKEISRQLEYYYMSNPDAVARLLAIESESPGAMEIIVTPEGMYYSTHTNGGEGCATAADQIVEADMIAIFGDYDHKSTDGRTSYNSSIRCQSASPWKQYAVVISCYNKTTGKPTAYPNIYYCAWPQAAYDGGYKWDNVISKNSYNAAFKAACGGDRIIE